MVISSTDFCFFFFPELVGIEEAFALGTEQREVELRQFLVELTELSSDLSGLLVNRAVMLKDSPTCQQLQTAVT